MKTKNKNSTIGVHEGSAVIQPCFEKDGAKMAPKLIIAGAPHNREDERRSIKEFTNARREILMLNLSIDTHQEEIDKLHEAYREKEKRLQRKEQDLAENMRRFDCLLREVDQREKDDATAKNLDEQLRIRKDKEIEVKSLSEQVIIVESMLQQVTTTIEAASTSKATSFSVQPSHEENALEGEEKRPH